MECSDVSREGADGVHEDAMHDQQLKPLSSLFVLRTRQAPSPLPCLKPSAFSLISINAYFRATIFWNSGFCFTEANLGSRMAFPTRSRNMGSCLGCLELR